MVKRKGKNLIDKFASLKGAKFIGIQGYRNEYGEIANHILNVNVDIRKAKEKDLETLKSFSHELLQHYCALHNVRIEIGMQALKELIHSAERNLTSDNRTTKSIAKTNTYFSLGKGLRLRKDTLEVYVSGFANSKEVIVEGKYPSRNKQEKTIIKDEIRKYLKMSKFKNFNLGKVDTISVTGDTIIIY